MARLHSQKENFILNNFEMKITICGSITFMDEMERLEKKLIKMGFSEVFMPIGLGDAEKKQINKWTVKESAQRKIDLDLINMHWRKVLKADCILVANYEKKEIPGYVGGNTFLEMGFAFVTGKPIFMLNPIPDMDYSSEMRGMQPIVINNKLSKIKEYYKL
jgi:hypothetical protein